MATGKEGSYTTLPSFQLNAGCIIHPFRDFFGEQHFLHSRNYPKPTICTVCSIPLLHLCICGHVTLHYALEACRELSEASRRQLQAFVRHQLPAAHQHPDIGRCALNLALAPAAGAGPKGVAAGHPAADAPAWQDV